MYVHWLSFVCLESGLSKDDKLTATVIWKETSVLTDSTECSCLWIELLLTVVVMEEIFGVFALGLYELHGLITRPAMFCIACGCCSPRDGGISASRWVKSLLQSTGVLDNKGLFSG